MCSEWRDSFVVFEKWAMENGYQDHLTIDRVDTDGNYEPSNCRWATWKEQENNRSNNKIITHNGETKTVTQWSEFSPVSTSAFTKRIEAGWTMERALSELKRQHRSKHNAR